MAKLTFNNIKKTSLTEIHKEKRLQFKELKMYKIISFILILTNLTTIIWRYWR